MANPNKTELSTNSDRLMRMISRKNDIESLLISVGQDYRKEEIEKEEYDYLNHHFEHELNALNKQIIEAKISVQIPHSEEDQLSDVVCEFIQHKNVLQITRYLLHSLVEKVIVYKDRQIKVTFKFQDEIEEIKTKIENIRKKV